MCLCFIFFFVKQKTAYEMRISDWSSDVCSSDLAGCGGWTQAIASAGAMIARRPLVCLLAALAAASPVLAQTTVEEAREEGRKLGNETRRDSTLVPTDTARAEAVPGYAGTALPEGAYFDDPDRLEAARSEERRVGKEWVSTG